MNAPSDGNEDVVHKDGNGNVLLPSEVPSVLGDGDSRREGGYSAPVEGGGYRSHTDD